MAEQQQSSGMFSIFLFTIFSLVLIPYTLWRWCSEGDVKAQAVAPGKKKRSLWQEAASKALTKGNLVLILMWVAWALLLWYIQATTVASAPFDPFEILGVERGATDREIKKAYRKLSLQFHPDKNPDPKAASYFASHISKAYAALTDEVSRMNYEKHGHPDGPQGMNLGVALPEWMFSKDKKTAPLILLGLMGGGILLPLAIVSYIMLQGDKYSGPNRIHNYTIMRYFSQKFGIRESQSLVRIPETLMCAEEFVLLYTPNEHTQPMEELRRMVAPRYPDVMGRDKKAFWNRKASVVKAHMLLLAHLERMGDEVPPLLQPDLKFVRTKCLPLLDEMMKIACLPRNQLGFGWMTPALACVEMMQCIAQAMPTSSRKGSGKGGEALAPLLALPHFDQDVIKKLRRQRVTTLKELQDLSEADLQRALSSAGLSKDQSEEVSAYLQAMPQLAAGVEFVVEGEDELCERDPVHCKVRVLLTRPAHASPGFELVGSAVGAYTPSNPEPQDEAWYAILTDTAKNYVVAHAKANLIDAERASLENPGAFAELAKGETNQGASAAPAASSSGGGGGGGAKQGASGGGNGDSPTAADGADAAAVVVAAPEGGKRKKGGKCDEDEGPPGQILDLMFMAPPTGRYDLTLHIMSSTWVGADLAVPARLKVAALSRAAAEGREVKPYDKKRFDSDTSEDEDDRESAASGSGSDEDDYSYDSEETGELESSEEEEGIPPLVGDSSGEEEEEGGQPGGLDKKAN